MINLVLATYARQMEQYMGSWLRQPEGLVEVGAIGSQNEDEPCKIVISLLSVERESTAGIAAKTQPSAGRFAAGNFPLIYANLNVVIAAVFTAKRYKESLSFLSMAIAFLQATPYFTTPDGTKYTIELLSPTLQDQSNVWPQMGGRYYPSVACKIRRLTFDANEIKKTMTYVTDIKPEVGL